MGGICGFLGFDDSSLLKKMSNAIAHRGREVGFFIDDGFGICIRALKDEASQAIAEDKLAAFHGEIYNEDFLKSSLKGRGKFFKPSTSSEPSLILQLFIKDGYSFVDKLIGSFIFIIWDSKRKELLMARDKFGEKPIYFIAMKEKLLFASEIKALLQYEELKRSLDFEALDFFFTYGHVPIQNTLFKGIKKLLPAHMLKYNKGKIDIREYWHMRFPKPIPLFDENLWCKMLYDSLMTSVESRLKRGLPPYGILLGGIDSSTLASLMKRLTSEPIHAFTTSYEDEEFNEQYAKGTAEWLGIEFHERILYSKDVIKILSKLAWVYDDLIADFFTSTPTYHLVELAKDYVKTIFTGDIAGYNLWAFPDLTGLSRLELLIPKYFRKKIILYSLRKSPCWTENRLLKPIDKFIKRIAFSISPDVKTINWLKFYNEDELYELYRLDIRRRDIGNLNQPFFECLDEIGYNSWVNKERYFMNRFKIIMRTVSTQGFFIPRGERICSAFSLDVKMPYFDYSLLQTMQKIPLMLKHPEKYILRKMVLKYSLLPNEIAWQKKKGFACPMQKWLKGDLKDYAVKTIFDSAPAMKSIFNEGFMKKIALKGNAYQVFVLLMFLLWYRVYFEGFMPS